MIRPIVKSPIMLSRPCSEATPLDAPIAQDLLDTFAAHRDRCVGMAANMIGAHKQIIVVDNGASVLLMYNPKIIAQSGPYEAEESCLSLDGSRTATRYQHIKVGYLDAAFTERTSTFTGYAAQVIQHEIDHCNGVVI